MRTICLYFQIHQPFRFRRYRFFDIGREHYYYDDYMNESIMRKVADRCYLPANKIMLDLIKKHEGKFRVAYSISGSAIDQFELYAPEVLESFKKLAKTGCVEFLSETYSHSLSSLTNRAEFEKQVGKHRQKIKELFGVEPGVFRNTELIYSDEIGAMVADMGYKGIITEGPKHVLGWKSPNYMYYNAINPKLKVLLKNFKLSDDIAFRFSDRSWAEFPLTADKFASWLKALDKNEETVNLFMDYEAFGERQGVETGIHEFLKAFPSAVFKIAKFSFSTPSQLIESLQPIAPVHVPNAISWADEERDLTAWLGNELQWQAFNKLYELREKVESVGDPRLSKDFEYLQISDHFYYMSTKYFSAGENFSYFNPFGSPYDAFINYMNILSDFEIRLNSSSVSDNDPEVSRLRALLDEKESLIIQYAEQLKKKAVKKTPAKTTSKKTPAAKTKSVAAAKIKMEPAKTTGKKTIKK
ncbi:MAG: polysaccharide deacetylase family protein [Bacteroidales bacterium]|nr:polysaccharide deacetylase family protein [Bacteroidales bacterium]MCB8998619.1 polysaccharide deacetylase family protein [Bacteroidales bacterium]MCB9012513.1 polysaccharide deacetylase family protein [Bacteroidales bacterium]